ncbi:FAD-dependent oxidoreductase [Erwinia tracheiphila]|uniref:FAD-dependent oxidoreductase n=1 Tax=Erwinia tracheiphila TaxID=65700 RepID=A0A345CV70_9GAMM|nr:FAD-dependent oxidoreductase [Erwinia tracheiphila]AXF77337.1 FAD-dependent oxidoreductase [Erwinia tracheiphila]UIA83975.1 FAD-dependent oxidoreductase [Erwinia tracheiphila]UIA92557.1 FAD-dependent oxidoreductase [Erwinia tracheiphila]
MNKKVVPSAMSCCIVGGGPAGLMLGYLFARRGITVTVLEKHGDFLRDFRGNTIHPSTMEIISQLGFLDELLAIPHQKAERLYSETKGKETILADFSHLPTRCKYIAFMPQWDFLHLLYSKASLLPGFSLIKKATVNGLIEEQGAVRGVRAQLDGKVHEFRCDLVIGCDGRDSTVRDLAGLDVRRFGAPRDVLWLKISKLPGDPVLTMGHRGAEKNFIMVDRGSYWQCGYSISKGSFPALKENGLADFLQQVTHESPFDISRLQQEITDWQHVSLLKIRIDRLDKWAKNGLLCIGDAAHAMSPIGGVGVNLAIQDAVATANLLSAPLKTGRLTLKDLQKVQRRRIFPTWATQSLQIMISKAGQNKRRKSPGKMELWLRQRKCLARLSGRLIGIGFFLELPNGG